MAVAAATPLSACSGAAPALGLPGLSLGTSPPAQAAFRPMLKRWANALTKEERGVLKKDLEAFLKSYPDDGEGPAAEALLGWIAIERGDLVSAKRLSQSAANLGPGSWQDFATVIRGAVQRRHGDLPGAIATLKPLVSKLIDPWARDILNEEVIDAAIISEDARLALSTMSIWLREAGDDDRLLIRSRVERALTTIHDAELVKLFDERVAIKPPSPESEIDTLLAQRLAAIAIAAKDAVLAKKLLLTSGALLGDRGDPVARLSAGAAAIRVDARTVGLLLSFRTAETRRRSAEIAAGVTWGLELPGSGARLAVRDDSGDSAHIEDALKELGRDGAAVVIAGIDDDDARAAAKFAADQHVPVILIARPSDLAAGGAESFVFPLGASPQGWAPRDDARFGAWVTAHGGAPSFWAAAGRDAAVLARQSVKDLPQEATEERAEVEARRRTVREALGKAGGGLWTVERPAQPPAQP